METWRVIWSKGEGEGEGEEGEEEEEEEEGEGRRVIFCWREEREGRWSCWFKSQTRYPDKMGFASSSSLFIPIPTTLK